MAFSIRVGVKALIVEDDKLLLVKYHGLKGVHYNLPGGGVSRREAIRKALRREVYEETGCKVDVGPLLLVAEYNPKKHKNYFGKVHKLTLLFRCDLKDRSDMDNPPKPDRNQVGLEWFPLDSLPENLYPLFHERLREAIRNQPERDSFTTKK